jgi:hypothetical protein
MLEAYSEQRDERTGGVRALRAQAADATQPSWSRPDSRKGSHCLAALRFDMDDLAWISGGDSHPVEIAPPCASSRPESMRAL